MTTKEFSKAQAAVLERYGVDAEERWVRTPIVDGRAHVLVAGDGPPVVMLNGIGVPAAMFAPLIAHMSDVKTYAVDLPGYGLSDSTRHFSDDLRGSAVQFLREVFDGLELDRPTIVANSLGSLWASWLTIDQPNRVEALAHIGCPAIVLDTSAPLPMRLLGLRLVGRLLMKVQPPSDRQVEYLAKMVNEHPLPREIAQLILATERLDHFEETFPAMLNRLVRLRGNRPDLALNAHELSRIETPTLLVFARNDPMGGVDVGQQMSALVTDAELHIVNGGHAPWIHHAAQIAPALISFLRRVSLGQET